MLGVPEKANGLSKRKAILFDSVFAEPNRRPKWLPGTIPLIGNKTGSWSRIYGLRPNCKPLTLVRYKEIGGEKRFF
jgi:hypothetical protein